MTQSLNLKLEAHPSQLEFINDMTLYAAAVAGLGSGKTHGGALKALLKCLNNPGIRGCVTAPTYKVLNDATIPKYQQIFPGEYAKFIGGDSPMARLSDGSEIVFRSTDKPDHLRGMEIGWFHMDEAALSPFIAFDILKGRLRQKRKDGSFYPFQGWITSTPQGLNWLYTEFAMQERPDYKLFQWSTLDNCFMDASYVNRLDYSGKHRQQELEGKFLILSGECFFDVENLHRRLKTDCKDPVAKYDDGLVSLWKDPVVGVPYVAGIDCADEGGGGANCMVIMNRQTKEEVLEVYGDIASDNFARRIDEWGRKYNKAYLGIEKNGTVGGYIVAKLEDMKYPALYRDDKGKTGWFTGGFNRATMLEEYKIAVNRNQTTTYSREAIAEMLSFVANSRGKYEHIANTFDDRVLARAICYWMSCLPRWGGNSIKSYKRLATTYA